MTNQTRLREIVTEEPFTAPQQTAQPQAGQAQAAALQLLMLALKTLSQRTIVALAALRGLVLAGSVFWLAYVVVQSPDAPKLTGLGIYAVFVLAAEMLTRRK